MSVQAYDGFTSLIDELDSLIKNVEKPTEILEVGAKELVKDLLKLTKPYSKITGNGYTHLVDSFCYEIKGNEIEVGWGKYYGRMVEEGTKLAPPQPHLVPTFERNNDKYYEKMIERIYR